MSRDKKTAEMAATEKTTHRVAKGAFTKARNTLTSQTQKGAEDSVTLVPRNSIVKYYSKLEEAHTNYLVAAQIDIMESPEEVRYLNLSYQEVKEALLMCSKFLKRRDELREAFEAQEDQLRLDMEREAKFVADQNILGASIVNFEGQSPTEKLSKLIHEGVSFF